MRLSNYQISSEDIDSTPFRAVPWIWCLRHINSCMSRGIGLIYSKAKLGENLLFIRTQSPVRKCQYLIPQISHFYHAHVCS